MNVYSEGTEDIAGTAADLLCVGISKYLKFTYIPLSYVALSY